MKPLPDKTIVVSHRAIQKTTELTVQLISSESILIRDRQQVKEYLERELSAFGQEEFSAGFVNGSIKEKSTSRSSSVSNPINLTLNVDWNNAPAEALEITLHQNPANAELIVKRGETELMGVLIEISALEPHKGRPTAHIYVGEQVSREDDGSVSYFLDTGEVRQ